MTTPPVTLAPPSRPEDRRLETPRAAGVAGLAFAALFVTSLVLLRDQPSRDSTAAEIRNFYLREHGGTVALAASTWSPSPGSRSCGSLRSCGA
jgi:hypothetical protein